MRRSPADRLDPDDHALPSGQAGLFGIQVRYESQRTDEGRKASVLRGPRTLGSGQATLGDGLGSLWRLDPPALDEREHAVIGERLRCVAGMLVDRQVDEAEASSRPGPASPAAPGSRPVPLRPVLALQVLALLVLAIAATSAPDQERRPPSSLARRHSSASPRTGGSAPQRS